eukprot:c12499_g1_i2.p2 GENE.c12499_g1_i2~~c12499_g1_i2.p2  ORF type:complete len:112 (+),score=18.01 c12499_g1_i2:308-643(+)
MQIPHSVFPFRIDPSNACHFVDRNLLARAEMSLQARQDNTRQTFTFSDIRVTFQLEGEPNPVSAQDYLRLAQDATLGPQFVVRRDSHGGVSVPGLNWQPQMFLEQRNHLSF